VFPTSAETLSIPGPAGTLEVAVDPAGDKRLPVGRSWDFKAIVPPSCPWLVIQGDADEIVDADAVAAWVAKLPHPPVLVRMPDTSHFFHRKLMDLRGAIRHGVRAWLPHG
jgi:alpha/beta superfamily hydrolase